MNPLVGWLNKRRALANFPPEAETEPVEAPVRAVSGKYRLLYKYLAYRYANTVVLTFAQIEDLLGFALPEEVSLHGEWWTDVETAVPGAPRHSDSWILANRTARPNPLARVVVFEHVA